MENDHVSFQLVLAHIYQRNVAERAIRTWKNHFLARLNSVDEGFPMHLWYLILDQVDITLNLLQLARINSTISACNMIWGTFDFNRTTMGPPGCRIIFHENPGNSGTWSFHGVPGFTLDPL